MIVPKLSARTIGESIAILGVVLSLIFVDLEQRQGGKGRFLWASNASTRYVNFILRVFVAGPDDFNAADQLRRQTKLYPLSEPIST